MVPGGVGVGVAQVGGGECEEGGEQEHRVKQGQHHHQPEHQLPVRHELAKGMVWNFPHLNFFPTFTAFLIN